jgi:hypothetical protein
MTTFGHAHRDAIDALPEWPFEKTSNPRSAAIYWLRALAVSVFVVLILGTLFVIWVYNTVHKLSLTPLIFVVFPVALFGPLTIFAATNSAALRMDDTGIHMTRNGVKVDLRWSEVGELEIRKIFHRAPSMRPSEILIIHQIDEPPDARGFHPWHPGLSNDQMQQIIRAGIARWGKD